MDFVLQRFGENVRAARLARGWTQEDLSGQSGLAPVQVSPIEREAREVRLTTVVRLLDALEVRADQLFDGVREMTGERESSGDEGPTTGS